MRRVRIGLVVGLGVALGAGAAFAVNVGHASADTRICPNTWCGPGGTACAEVTGWACSLSGGCSGANRCD